MRGCGGAVVVVKVWVGVGRRKTRHEKPMMLCLLRVVSMRSQRNSSPPSVLLSTPFTSTFFMYMYVAYSETLC